MNSLRMPGLTASSLLAQQPFLHPFAPCTPSLPAELWMYIFELVILSPFTRRDVSPLYIPFTATPLRERDWELAAEAQQSLDIKRTLVLVCRAWRHLGQKLMYRHIRAQRKLGGLMLALGTGIVGQEGPFSRTSEDYARWVRSLEITGRHNLDYNPSNPSALLPLLIGCASTLEHISRPTYPLPTKSSLSAIQLGPDTIFPTFTALRRIDWWLPIQPRASVPFQDLLGQILTNAPKLEYLTLCGGERTFGYASETAGAPAQQGPGPVSNTNGTIVANSQQTPGVSVSPAAEPPVTISLPSLQTLRLECKNRSALITPTWILPSLRHVIIGADYFAALPILSTHGHLISTLEILQGSASSGCLRVPFGGGVLRELLEFCPNLEDVAFNTDQSMTLLGDQKAFAHPVLKTVRLMLGEQRPLNPNLPLGVLLEKWNLDKLERVVLYGCWDDVLAEFGFVQLKARIKQRGIEILCCGTSEASSFKL